MAVVAQKLVILEMWQAAGDLGLLGCGTAAHMSVHRNTSRWYVRYYVSGWGSLKESHDFFVHDSYVPLIYPIASNPRTPEPQNIKHLP